MSLWDNIRKRRAAGKRKLKPGDKNYPKTLNIEAARPQVRWKRGKYPGDIEATIGGKKYKIEKALDHNDRHKGEWKVMVWDKGDWEWETTEYGKANAKAWIMNKHGIKESVQPHPAVIKAYKNSRDAEHRDGEYGTTATKRAVTRTANTLSKKINQHHPDLDMQGKIAIRTKLQNMKEDWVCGKCNCEPCTCGEVNEEVPGGANTASIPNPADTAMGPRFKPKNVTDRRRKKEMVLLKRFRKHMEENG